MKALGWIEDGYDGRDLMYSAPVVDLPAYTNLISDMPPVYDQDQLGSCVAQGLAGMVEHLMRRQKIQFFTPSRLLIYYEGRRRIGAVLQDSGMRPRDGLKVIVDIGSCPEMKWPYDIKRFAEKPPEECYDLAEKHQVLQYKRIDRSLHALKHCLSMGYPFGFGMQVYASMMTKHVEQTGWVPLPKPGEECYGRHYVVAVGYDDKAGKMICRNSWGQWGMGGHFLLDYSWFTNEKLTDDFLTLRLMEV